MTLSDNNTEALTTLTATEMVDRWHDQNREQAKEHEPPIDERRSEVGEMLTVLRESEFSEPVAPEIATESVGTRALDWLLSPRVRQTSLLLTTVGALTLGAWLLVAPLLDINNGDGTTGPLGLLGEDERAITSEASAASEEDGPALGRTVEGQSADGLLRVTATRSDNQTSPGWQIVVEDDWPASAPAEVSVLVNGVVVERLDQAPFEFWLNPESLEDDGISSVGPIVVSAIVEWRNGSGQGSPATVVLTLP